MLKGRVAIVTGAGTGIGAAIARLLAENCCHVVLAGRRSAPLQTLALEIGGVAVPTNVASEADVASLFDTCVQSHGRLDILVNNAGIAGPTVEIERENISDWDEVFAVNVRGVMLCIKHAVPLMKDRGGAIVNVASDAVLRPKARRTAYAASKRAVLAITEATAQELGQHGIRVNSLVPGATDTEMLKEVFSARARYAGVSEAEIMEKAIRGTALKRISTPADIAAGALYLVGDASRTVTGTMLVIDAGMR